MGPLHQTEASTSVTSRLWEIGEIGGHVVKLGSLAMSGRKTLCDLGMVTVDFGLSDAETPDPGNTFRLAFRHRNGQQTGRIDVDQVEAEQFAAALAAAMTFGLAPHGWCGRILDLEPRRRERIGCPVIPIRDNGAMMPVPRW
jgi:hypothetical protein